jgi:hypothetical protein
MSVHNIYCGLVIYIYIYICTCICIYTYTYMSGNEQIRSITSRQGTTLNAVLLTKPLPQYYELNHCHIGELSACQGTGYTAVLLTKLTKPQ